jgi:hypothetical protein
VSNWATTVADLATGAGTLVLAVATFASVRSANRSTATAQEALQAGLRPVMMNSRFQDPRQKVMFGDGRWVHLPGGAAAVEIGDNAIYLAVSIRNAGTGMGILHGWRISARLPGEQLVRPPLDEFTPQTRDLYVGSGDVGFWQGALRDPDAERFKTIQAAIESSEILQLDLLYGDFEGGQRVISRFTLAQSPFGQRPHGENLTDAEIAAQGGDSTGPVEGRGQGQPGSEQDQVRWIASVVRHWNVDRPDPR